jgi:hypothetical protein
VERRSISWEKLKDLKASNPGKIAKYAVANRLVEEPAFKWWVPNVLRRRNRIISKVKSRCCWQTTQPQFGIRLVPKAVAEALEIDKGRRHTRTSGKRPSTRNWPKSRSCNTAASSRMRSTGTDWFPRDRMPYHLRCQDEFYMKGSICCWRSYDQSTELHDIFKSCISWQHPTCIPVMTEPNDLEIMSCDLENVAADKDLVRR